MATYIFRLDGNSIIGHRDPSIDNAVIPADSVEVTEAVYNTLGPIIATMRADGRRDHPEYIGGVVVIPTDTRTVLTVSIVASDVKLSDASNITITLPNAPNYSGAQYLDAFQEIFRFDFVDGSANRTDILFPSTGIFKFKSNATLKISTPFDVRVYR